MPKLDYKDRFGVISMNKADWAGFKSNMKVFGDYYADSAKTDSNCNMEQLKGRNRQAVSPTHPHQVMRWSIAFHQYFQYFD